MTGHWTTRAVCREEDPELFFPVGTGPGAAEQTRQAQAVCGRCPVAAACLAHALSLNAEQGIWGGLDEDQRRRYRARTSNRGGSRSKAVCGSLAAYRRHLRRKEPIDPACREANRLAQQEKAANAKAVA